MTMEKDWNPIPTEKSDEVENALSILFGVNRKESITEKVCVSCEVDVKLDDFREEISLREFHISGLCQTCQDGVFGTNPENNENSA